MYYYKNFINNIPESLYLQFIIDNYHSDNCRLDYSISDLQNYIKNSINSHACFCINEKNEIIGSIIITKYHYLNEYINYINFACVHFQYRKQNIILNILKEISSMYSKNINKINSISDYILNAKHIIGNILFSTEIKIPEIQPFYTFNFINTSFINKKEAQIKKITKNELKFLNNNYIKFNYLEEINKYIFLEVNRVQVVCYNLNFINKFNQKTKNVYIIDSSELLTENEIQNITHYFISKNIDHITFLSTLFKKNIVLKNTIESKTNYIYTNVLKLNNLIIF